MPPTSVAWTYDRRVRAEDVVALAVDRAQETDPRIGRRVKACDVRARKRGVADDGQREVGGHAAVGVDDDVRIVLRFQPTDVEHVLAGHEPEPPECPVVGDRLEVGPVREVVGLAAIRRTVVLLDDASVRDDLDRQVRRDPRTRPVVEAPDRIPFRTLPFEPVDVQDHAPASQHQDDRRGHVRGVADVHDVVAASEQMEGAEQGVDHRLEVLRPRSRQPDDVASPGTSTRSRSTH